RRNAYSSPIFTLPHHEFASVLSVRAFCTLNAERSCRWSCRLPPTPARSCTTPPVPGGSSRSNSPQPYVAYASAGRYRLEALQVARDIVPRWPLAHEDRDRRLELRGIVERAGIEIDHALDHLRGPVDGAIAGRAREARSDAAAAARAARRARLAGDRHCPVEEGDEADVARAAHALTGAAMAEAHGQRLALRAPAQRAAGTSTGHRHGDEYGTPDTFQERLLRRRR